MALVRRIFDLFAQNHPIRRVKAILEEDGIKTPNGNTSWSRLTLRKMILSDIYKPHTYSDLEELSRRGFLTKRVLGSLDPNEVYGVWWYNTKHRDRERKKVSNRPEEEHIAVPVPDARLGIEVVTAARTAVMNNIRATQAVHREHWELLGLSSCVCGEKLGTHTVQRRNGAYAHYYVCTRRRHDRCVCEHARYHRAVPLEKRIRAYTRSLLRKPEIITEQTEAYIASERDKRRRDPQAEEAALRAQLEKLATKRARYLEQYAEELITTEALKSRLAEIDRQRIGAEGEIAILKDRESHLTSLEKLARDFVLDLPDLLKDLSEDAAADLYRDVYERLGYQLVVHEDGRIDIHFGVNGEAHVHVADLEATPTPPPPPEDPVWDTWQEGDPIPEPTGGDVLEICYSTTWS